MTRDDVIRMAIKAGLFAVPYPHPTNSKEVERFAALVAASEREACAKVCEEIEDEYREHESLKYAELRTDAQTGASDCAATIRIRGNQ